MHEDERERTADEVSKLNLMMPKLGRRTAQEKFGGNLCPGQAASGMKAA